MTHDLDMVPDEAIALSYRGDPALLGGWLCLDFTNTVGGRYETQPRQYITNYPDLLAWSLHADVLETAQAAWLLTQAEAHPTEAALVLRRSLALREAIYSTVVAAAAGEPPPGTSLAIINTELSGAMAQAQLLPAGDGRFVWGWPSLRAALDGPLWPLVRSAAELLRSERLVRVRSCANETCGWLFLDTSKNHSRRWCSMDDCGNRAKAQRHYRKTRGKG